MHISLTYSPVINELFRLTNEVRAEHGLNPLVRSFPLDQAAQWMANDMFENNYISHQDSWGNWVTQRHAVRLPGRQGWYAVGENLASGQATPERAIQSWMDSEGHQLNMLRGNWVSVGLGHCARRWVQVFGSV
jgi:Uncharacterized protein with SCP/PR1 domains